MPALSTLLRLLLVATLAVNGWAPSAHAMAGADAVSIAPTSGASPADGPAFVQATATATAAMPSPAAPASGPGCHDDAAAAADAPPAAPVAAQGDDDCCASDGCSDCRCAMAGGIALAPAPRIAAMRPVTAPLATAVAAPPARTSGQVLRPPIA